ncbi:hypothetical protein L8R98_00155 [Vibrio splendidus]|uniref:hypothetical protein n=1 Tax=Vibrio splendidus TaxID=29497 RepID=UPI00246892E0|nr:hypothetical protein [Vibrio splendidus]MDH5975180.1 hypothetical protein [Vibrio splendidus]
MPDERNILALRTKACEIMKNNFITDEGCTIWGNTRSTGFTEERKAEIERAVCTNQCLPISVVVFGLMNKSKLKTKQRVVIGQIIANSDHLNCEAIRKAWSRITTHEGFGSSNYHSWIEVSQDNFKTYEIVDLTYACGKKNLGQIINFDATEAKRLEKKHVRVLTGFQDVANFLERRLASLTVIRDANPLRKKQYITSVVQHLYESRNQ